MQIETGKLSTLTKTSLILSFGLWISATVFAVGNGPEINLAYTNGQITVSYPTELGMDAATIVGEDGDSWIMKVSIPLDSLGTSHFLRLRSEY